MLQNSAPRRRSRIPFQLDQLLEVGGSAVAARIVDEARQFFDQTFFSGQTVTPELASTGTGLIARAVQHCGIRDWIGAVQRFDDPRRLSGLDLQQPQSGRAPLGQA